MSSLSMLGNEQADATEEVTWEDQSRINAFSKYNKRLEDIEELLTDRKTEREQLDDLSMELELADEDAPVLYALIRLYKLGDAFVSISLEKAQEQIEADVESLDSAIEELKSAADDCEKNMSELKVHLKSKFKDSINLDR
ncbi:Prefoldin, subunit 4 [Wallemia mellicola]|uniref:Prefoldin subunit 4 n=1 Tax=Wallemia mellicola TaxID=1708541 RepID=A0A4T0MCS7_9BASI|nr:Prefoldin, subunit 4 [Wallemia mellicola]